MDITPIEAEGLIERYLDDSDEFAEPDVDE
jgi:hypothetical protein